MLNNKVIKSKDGKIEVRYDDVENVCVCMSHFALLQYMLLQDENSIKKTCFIFSEHIDKKIVKRLPAIQLFYDNGIKRRLNKIKIHLFSRLKYPFLSKAKIFAQDHVFPIGIIGRNHYALLSDGPRFLTAAQAIDTYQKRDRIRHSFRGFIESLLYGNITLYPMGIGNQCDELFLTEMEDVPVCHSKKVHVNTIRNLWDSSSISKREFISYVFDVTPDDIELLKSRPLMYMTQAIDIDYELSSDEYVQLLSKIFSHYEQDQLLLKLHPRDKFDYRKFFPKVAVYSKTINMQLLSLYDIRPEKVITIFSSSVESFPDEVQVDWFGIECHPKIKSHYTSRIVPNRKFNQMTL